MDSSWKAAVAETGISWPVTYLNPLNYPVVANIPMQQKLGQDKCIVYYSNKRRSFFFYKTKKLFSFQSGFLYNVLPLEKKITVMCVSFVKLCLW